MKVVIADYCKFEIIPKLQIGITIKVADFIEEVKAGHINALKGRNKASDHIDTDNHNFIAQAKFAQKHKLWHYHLGVPNYEKSNQGDLVSDWMVHYKRYSDRIVIVDVCQHPFKMPDENMLEQQS